VAEKREPHHVGVGYEHVTEAYLHKRSLRTGAAGWLLLVGLGVGYVISGDFAGWNFGLGEGGWGGLLIATILMAVMYTAMTLGLAELSSTISTAGGGYGFARRAMGPWGGFLTGTAILIEYAIAPAAVVIFIGGYVESLGIFGIEAGWWVYLLFFGVVVGVQLMGVAETLKVVFAVTAIAVVALIVFWIGMIPKFDANNLTDIAVDTDKAGASEFLPFGYIGIWAALPFAIWFFLAIEGVPLAAEETAEPAKSMPRGILTAMGILLLFAALMITLAPGGGGAEVMSDVDDPLPTAAEAADAPFVKEFVNWVGLFGLLASFFAVIFAYTRQLFALSRAGYLPRRLSVTSRRKVPYIALILPAGVGFTLAAITEAGDKMIAIAVFGATLSYILMMTAHIVLRFREPDLERPYRTPGGIVTTSIALVLAVAACIATFLVDTSAAAWTAGIYLAALLFFGLYSRKRLVAEAPEEEFEFIEAAEAELAG
jgi:ethanolamine permease